MLSCVAKLVSEGHGKFGFFFFANNVYEYHGKYTYNTKNPKVIKGCMSKLLLDCNLSQFFL